MVEIVPYSLGQRVAFYRKKLKLSAEELADRAGQGLSRSIIANLENGRKDDVTVQQLISLAYHLGVSPADLAFDLKSPYKYMEISSAGGRVISAPVWILRDWFGGFIEGDSLGAMLDNEPVESSTSNSEGEIMMYILRGRDKLLTELSDLETQLTILKDKIDDDTHPADYFAAAAERRDILRGELGRVENMLRARGFDMDNTVGVRPVKDHG
jgi:transcriptional regulator with XRE-family HTH domain